MKLKVFRIVTNRFAASVHLSNFLKRVDSDIIVYVFGDDIKDLGTTYEGIFFIDIPIKRKINLYYDFISVFMLSYYILKYKPHVVHSIMPKAGLISAISSFVLKVPNRLHTFTGQIWLTNKGYSKYLYICIDRIINRLNTRCLTDSKTQSDFLKNFGIYDKKRNLPLSYLGKGSLSGVDLLKLNPDLRTTKYCLELKEKLGFGPDDFILTYMARKTLDKGALDILEIFCLLDRTRLSRNTKLLFIGPDESNGLVEAFLQRNVSENIINIGVVEDYEYYLAISDLLCLPSHKEGFGSVVIDAAAVGVPTIGYDIIGLKDAIVDMHTGWLIKENDKKKFTDQILEIIENERLLLQMARNAFENCTTNFNADDYHLELLEKHYSL